MQRSYTKHKTMKRKTLGEQLNPILVEIEGVIMEYNAEVGKKPGYPIAAFRAACQIFISAIIDKTFELMEAEHIDEEDRGKMATKAGEDIRQLVKTYTGIDSYDLYK